jgi:hypothetical protein
MSAASLNCLCLVRIRQQHSSNLMARIPVAIKMMTMGRVDDASCEALGLQPTQDRFVLAQS